MRKAGLSVLEFLVVLIVLAILLTLGVVGYQNYRQNLLIRQAAAQFAADLLYWRSQARKTSLSYQVQVTPDSNTYQIGEYDPDDPDGFRGATETKTLPRGTQFSSATVPKFQFYAPYGITAAANNSIEIRSSTDRRLRVNLVGVTAKVVVRAP
ncbi:pilus assembly FimT family protein [Calidithermus terrae]|uniref:pilus assembly FimT family protein n=1 Tax=Calidithermus terrae TaxID=1408545 RepID=UPI0011C441A8|nr:GspH/FimT family pseudopilin [Calidithermus terrae]